LLSVSILLLISFVILPNRQKNLITQRPSPTPTPFNPFPYSLPKIPSSRSYKTVLVGDSMVEALGPNANLLRLHLIEHYPTHYNYGFGATNIKTLPERLTKNTSYNGQNFPSILSQGYDLIIIESFSYNPLSESSVEKDISKHIQILDDSIRQIIRTRPNLAVALMVTIAPNKALFAKGVYDLSSEDRIRWAQERISYIEAVIKYANEKGIPLINVYEKSLTPKGDGDLKYINRDDHIHPSAEGVDLISRTIADFIFSKKLFPE